MTDPTYEAWQDIRHNAHEQFRTAVDRYMTDLPDLSRLRWVRHWLGPRAQSPTGQLRDRLAAAMHHRVHLAAVDYAESNAREFDDPDVLNGLDWESMWAQALADITGDDARSEVAAIPEDADTERVCLGEILGLVEAWRTGGPVPRRLIWGASDAATRVGLQPSDVRARMSRGHFPPPDETRPAAYGQTSPGWWADTLDTWWERKPVRGPQRSVRPAGNRQ
jgi:hypothetical protein